MKKIIAVVTTFTSLFIFTNTIAGSISAKDYSLELRCLDEEVLKECRQLIIVQTFNATGEINIHALPKGNTVEVTNNFMTFIGGTFPKVAPNLKTEKNNLTTFGKITVAWFRYPYAMIADDLYMKSITNIKAEFKRYFDILIGPEYLLEFVNDQEQIAFFMSEIHKFIYT